MVADTITASNYLSLVNWFSTTTHANISSLPSLSITESQISDLSHYTDADTGDYIDASTTIQTYFSNAATAFLWGNHATAGYLTYPVASSTYLALTDWYATTTWAGGSSLYVATTLAVATSTPWDGYELAVTGDGVFSGNLYVLGNATSSHLAAQEICLNGSCRTSWPEGGSGSSLWTASGNNIYYNSGNVGIATTSPTYALDVWGNARLATSTANVYLDFFGQYYTAPQNQSTNTATTSAATGASATWFNPTNITASDNSYASKTIDYYGSSGALKATNFGFEIPTGATISGIVLGVEGKLDGGSFIWTEVKLLKNGSAVGDNKTSMGMFTGIDKIFSTGGDSDLWGTTWTAEDINNTNFGATITLEDEDDTTGTVYVDHITIKVYYSYSVGKSTFASSIGIDKDNELFKISTSTGLTGK
ncbi:MAG TPA: hypothetical protein PLX67_03195, partial [bacterium]|nr:hypothetical protein [bacterium]